jgi:Rieske Fe-S protein
LSFENFAQPWHHRRLKPNKGNIMQLNRREFVIGTLATGCGCVMGCAGQAMPPLPTGPVDVGTMSDYSTDGVTERWAATHGFYVVRTAGKLTAISSVCTHQRCQVQPSHDTTHPGYGCKCHGSRFTSAGAVVNGPATVSLPHLAISVDPGGRITVDSAKTFDEKHWGDPGASLAVA